MDLHLDFYGSGLCKVHIFLIVFLSMIFKKESHKFCFSLQWIRIWQFETDFNQIGQDLIWYKILLGLSLLQLYSITNLWRTHAGLVVGNIQGWALRSFPFGTFRSYPFFKKNVPLFSILFSSFWRLMRPKRMFRSFPSQRTQHSFAKNIKERKNVSFFCKRTQKVLFFFQYI